MRHSRFVMYIFFSPSYDSSAEFNKNIGYYLDRLFGNNKVAVFREKSENLLLKKSWPNLCTFTIRLCKTFAITFCSKTIGLSFYSLTVL